MIDIICAICGKKQQTEVLYNPTLKEKKVSSYIYSARRFPDRLHYRILKCNKCGLIFSSPIFNPSQIAKLYKDSSCGYGEQIPFLAKTYLELFERIKCDLPENPKVLEVGCGNGFFLKELKRWGINNLHGVEPSRKMVSLAGNYLKRRIKVSIFKKGLFPENSFDIILCFHTLDHLTDPNEFIQESLSLLKKGGVVLVVVHDTEGLSVKLFKESSPIFDIEHIYLFNKKTLADIFNRQGLEVIKVFDVKNTYPLSYWLRMSGFPLFFKIIGQKILKMLMLSKIPLSLASGNIGIVAKRT